ncbi:hypothetical protein C0J52_14169 [Blattella germanica]|nr:hypothetical protein C0J52_14169 [Blattella germanica]
MAAIVRLKRRSDEEPLEALVLACKRKKLDGDLESVKDVSPFTTILKFAGTVKNQIVNCFRALKEAEAVKPEKESENSTSGEDEEKPLTIVDVVSHPEESKQDVSVPSQSKSEKKHEDGSSESEAGFVYDLYYASSGLEDEWVQFDKELVVVRPFHQSDWDYRTAQDSGDSAPEEDSDDSNDENNWRNDYPDSDHSIDEDDMRMAVEMNDMTLSDGEDLSSDTADEDFVYGVTVDPRDVMLYGEAYANYKTRILHELDGREDSDEDEAYNAESLSGEEDEDPAQRFT